MIGNLGNRYPGFIVLNKEFEKLILMIESVIFQLIIYRNQHQSDLGKTIYFLTFKRYHFHWTKRKYR